MKKALRKAVKKAVKKKRAVRGDGDDGAIVRTPPNEEREPAKVALDAEPAAGSPP